MQHNIFSTVVIATVQYVTVIKILKVLYCMWKYTHTPTHTQSLSLSLSKNVLLYYSSSMKNDDKIQKI